MNQQGKLHFGRVAHCFPLLNLLEAVTAVYPQEDSREDQQDAQQAHQSDRVRVDDAGQKDGQTLRRKKILYFLYGKGNSSLITAPVK